MILAMEKEVKKRFLDLHRHFKEQDIQLLACFSHYFITIFLYDTSYNIGIRIFDIFLLEGEKIIFDLLYKMLSLKRAKILELLSHDLYTFLRKKLVKECFEEYSLNTLLTPGSQEELEMDNL